MNKIVKFLLLAAVLVLVMALAPQTLSLTFSGFNDPSVLSSFQFYIVTGSVFLIGVAIIFFASFFMAKKGYGNYGDGIGFSENGEAPALSYFKRFTNTQLFFLSTIIFFILGLFTHLTQMTTFTGLGTLPQQFTPVQSIIFSTALIPIAENLGLAFVLASCILGLRILSKKYSLSKENFIGFTYFIPLIAGTFGWLWHRTVYSGSDLQQIVVFVFWTIGGFLTLVTGSFVPFWVMHLTNNLFYDMKRAFSNETILVYIIFTVIAMMVLYALIYKNRLFGAKRPITGDVI